MTGVDERAEKVRGIERAIQLIEESYYIVGLDARKELSALLAELVSLKDALERVRPIHEAAIELRTHEESCGLCADEPCKFWKLLNADLQGAVSDYVKGANDEPAAREALGQ